MARSNNKVLSETEIGDYEIILGLPYKVIMISPFRMFCSYIFAAFNSAKPLSTATWAMFIVR